MFVALGPNGPIGRFSPLFGLTTFAFRFEGLVIGSVIYPLPFVVQPICNAFAAMGERRMKVTATLRKSPPAAFCSVAPLARPGILTGAVLGFAHTMGEYGVVMMIGGNLPQTSVISTTIIQLNENQQYAEAWLLSVITVVFAFLIILSVRLFEKRRKQKDMP